MAEYIEHTCGECIHSDICEHIPTLTGWDALNPVYCRAFRNAADVVEVVRCKDCKRSGMYAFGCEDIEKLACLDIEEDGFIRFATSVDPNHFCSYGERRKSDGKSVCM